MGDYTERRMNRPFLRASSPGRLERNGLLAAPLEDWEWGRRLGWGEKPEDEDREPV